MERSSFKEMENKRNEDTENTCADLPPFRLRPPFHDRELLFESGPLMRSSPFRQDMKEQHKERKGCKLLVESPGNDTRNRIRRVSQPF